MRTKIQKLVFLAFSFLLMLVALAPTTKSMAAADGFPVAPPADTAGLNMQDYFVVSTASPKDFPNKARFSTAYPQALVVTPNTYNGWQIGGIWSKNKIDLNSPFTYNTEHYFGSTATGDDAAADGMTFTLQNDPLGQGAYGSPAGGLGAYPWSTNGHKVTIKNYIRNGLSIEMDDWLNNSNVADDQFDIDLKNTNSNGHLAVVRPGDTPLKSTNSATVGHLQYTFLPVPLANNVWKKFSVSWAPKVTYTNGVRILGGTLTYSLTNSAPGVATPQITTQTFNIPNVMTYFNSDHVYYGYTGATGRNKTFQAVSVMKTPQTAKPVTIHYVDNSGNELKTAATLNGEIGDKWDAAKTRPDWIKKGSDWYQYNGTYDSNVTPKSDAGQFSATTPYTVTYHYEKRTPPEKYELTKTARNTNADRGSSTFSDTVAAQKGDTIEFKIDYANLLSMKQGTITDLLPAGFTYKDGSLSIADDDTNGQYVAIDDTSFKQDGKIKFPYDMADGQGFSIKFSAMASSAGTLKNTATITPTGTGTSYTTPPVTVNVTTPPKTFHLHKYTVPAQGGMLPIAGAKYQLTDPNGTDTQTIGPSDNDGNAPFNITDFTSRIFTLKEIAAPAGYTLDNATYEMRLDGDGQYFNGLRVKDATNQSWQMTAQGSASGGNVNLPTNSTDTINAYDAPLPVGPALQKSVRNVTNGDSDPFTTTAVANADDEVEYQVDYTNQLGIVNPVLTDVLNRDLTFIPGSIKVSSSANGGNYTTQSDGTFGQNGQFQLPTNLALGAKVSIRFRATVNDPGLLSNIPNTARVDDALQLGQNAVSNEADVQVPRYAGIMITKYDQETNTTGPNMNGAVFAWKVDNTAADYASPNGYTTTDPTGHAVSTPGMDIPSTGQTTIAQTVPSLSDGFNYSQIYDVKEVTAPAGYAVNDKVYQVKWSADWARREMRVTGIREKPTDPWTTGDTPDGMAFDDNGQLGFRDKKTRKITVQTYDRVTETTSVMGTYTGGATQKLTDVHPGANIPGTMTDRDLWGYTIGQTFDPNAQLNPYDPSNIPDPQFGDTDLVLTYVYDQKMFELNPDPEINFGNFADNAVDRDYLLGENHTQTNQPIPFGVSATDRIGIRDWILSVSQNGQFDNSGHRLDDAQLEFNNMKVADKKNDGSDVGSVNLFTTTNDFTLNPDGTPKQIAHVRTLPLSNGQALYTQNLRFDFGDMNTGGNSVRVRVPRTTTRYRGQYNTSLTWTASYLP